MSTQTQEPPQSYRGSMQAPPKPEPIACGGGCGAKIEPYFIEPLEFNGRVLSFTNVWKYERNMCLPCESKRDAVRAMECEKDRENEKRDGLIEFLGGQRAYADYTFEKFNMEMNADAYRASVDFDPEKQNLYLWGPCGVGKSHLAYAIARKAFEYYGIDRVSLYKPPALMRHLRGLEPAEEESRISDLAASDVFILDDLGVGRATEFAVTMLYEISDARNMRRRNGLVVTSNLSLDQLAQKIGDDRLASRLGGMCKGNIFEMKGRDFRI